MLFLNIVTEFVNAFLHFFLAYWLFDCFWQKLYRSYISIGVLVVTSVICTPFLLCFKGSAIQYLALLVLSFCLSYLYQAKFLSRVLCTMIFFVIIAAIEMIVAFLMSWLFHVELTMIKEGVLFISGMLLSKFLMFILIISIKLKRKKALFQIVQKGNFTVFVYPFATLAIILLQHGIFVYSPGQSDFISVLVLVCYSLLIIANILIFEFIDTLYKNTIYETKINAANEIISQQTKQYEAVIEHHSEVVKLRHDQKNFCIGVLAELQTGNIETVVNKLESENAFLNDMTEKPNDIVRLLVAIKNEIAKKNGICIDFEYRCSEQLVLPAIDFSVILGNALDNAIEATANVSDYTRKTIRLVVTIKNKSIVITIKNPVEKKVDVANLRTTKEKSSMHGYGIISMKQLSERYNGDVTFLCSEEEFTTSIILSNFCPQRND